MNHYFISVEGFAHKNLNEMAFNWDFLIGGLVIVSLILIVWARVSKQTVGEVVGDIKDMLSGGKEEVEERVGGIIEYE